MDHITDIRGLVRALGGPKEVATLVGTRPTAVYMAMHRKVIPHRWRIPLMMALESKSVNFERSLLGIDAA